MPLPEPLPTSRLGDAELVDDSFADDLQQVTKAPDPFTGSDPWRSYIGTPTRTQRSYGAKSGMTPVLLKAHESLDEFLSGVDGPAFSPIPIASPVDGSPDSVLNAILSGQNALISGVNELRANAVTRQSLTQFYQLQSRAMQAYVQAETAPLHRGVAEIVSEVTQLTLGSVLNTERIGRLEGRLSQISTSGTESRASPNADNKNDANHCRISFKGFSTENLNTRFEIVKQFVEKFQGNDTFVCIDARMTGPYSPRKPTSESFAQFSSRDARDRVLLVLKDTVIKTATGNTIKVFRSKTDFIRSRDWAMGKSEELIKAKLQSAKISASVKFEKGKEARKITVDGDDAFVQRLEDTHGNFVGNFHDLQLP